VRTIASFKPATAKASSVAVSDATKATLQRVRTRLATYGLTEAAAQEQGIQPHPAKEIKLRKLWFHRDVGWVGVDGLEIPYHHPLTGARINGDDGAPFSRYRAVPNEHTPEDLHKYSQPKGSGVQIYYPQGIDWHAVHDDKETWLIITEGEFKAIKGAQEGFAVISIPGVDCYHIEGVLHRDLQIIPAKGRRVAIIFDSDLSEKDRVKHARGGLAHLLNERGAKVHVVDLPPGPNGEKVGLDDYLNAHTADELQALMEASPNVPPLPSIDDLGMMQEFVRRHDVTFRYCNSTGVWFIWSGKAWRKDETQTALTEAGNLCNEIADVPGIPKLKRAWLRRLSSPLAVERYAQFHGALSVTAAIWDADPWLLGTPDGTVDLRTGELMEPNPDDHITKLTAVGPAATADCPIWLRFLDEATGGKKGLIRFLQQWAGYCLTGVTTEQALLFIHGDGGNGKGVFVHVLSGIIAEYGRTAAMDTFTASYGTKHPTDMAMLRGARLVTASETEEGQRWDEQRIKQLTGGDEITAHFMRQDNFTFMPQLKLTIVGNHKPELKNVDDASKRRFNIVPFVVKPAKPDHRLEEKLRAEWPSILRWMIEGCLDWQRNGLVRPQIVVDATKEYFENQDIFPIWLSEQCVMEARVKTQAGELLENYNDWAFRNRARKINHQQFHDRVKKHPPLKSEKGRANVTYVVGVRLITPPPKKY
jgi:putative DNA primase/helicase